MKRGSSVLQPPSDAAKRHTHPANTHTQTHTSGSVGGDARSLSVSNTHAERTQDTHAEGSSPFPAATSLFSPDVSTKMASDLLIKLSEATQKAQVHPGILMEAEPQRREALLQVRGGQQDEPGLALSPDGPGASPEPPSLTHTPDGNATTDTLASDLLRKLAERQEVNCHDVRIKEEEEPMEVDTMAASDLIRDRPGTRDTSSSSPKMANHHLVIKSEDQGLHRNQHHEGKMSEQCLLGLKMEDSSFTEGSGSKAGDGVASGSSTFPFHGVSGTKMTSLLSGVKMEEQFLFKAKLAERPFSSAKFLSGVKMEDEFYSGVKMEKQLLSEAEVMDPVFSRAKAEEQLFFGAKMEDQCLRAVLWQDMSVNLASTLLHQLSERVSKSNSQPVDRSTPPIRSSPVLKLNGDPLRSPSLVKKEEPPHETQTSLSRDQTAGHFYRCHVCGFEMEGRVLFQSHMTEHRQWEQGSFSLRCCLCDYSTNQEPEMRAHADTHLHNDSGVSGDVRCPITPPATIAGAASSSSAPAVAMATQPEKSTSEHRCRICQRSFPGQQELLVHFQGHRQGNQYRCDRCGHLTRTANKLVEHVRVHTGERPFTCDLCPYSAKRRDSLRLHCKVKHAAHAGGNAADAPGDVHTHRSYVHGDNQRSNKHVQRLHTPLNTHTAAPSSSSSSSSSSLPPLHPLLSDRAGWRDLSPLLPITTLISLKPRSPPPPSSSSSSTKHSFLCYLGLTTSL